MNMRTLLLLVLLPFFTACQTTNISGINSLEAQKYQAIINHSCFFEGKGSFAANVASSQLPTVTWEGKWNHHYGTLQTQLVDPTGRVLQRNPFTDIEEKFGAKGLRRIMCGQTAFQNSIKIENHNIKVRSYIKSIPQNNNETILETMSEFYYGLFAQKSKITLTWKGLIKDGKMTPLFMQFGSIDEKVSIDFLDYE